MLLSLSLSCAFFHCSLTTSLVWSFTLSLSLLLSPPFCGLLPSFSFFSIFVQSFTLSLFLLYCLILTPFSPPLSNFFTLSTSLLMNFLLSLLRPSVVFYSFSLFPSFVQAFTLALSTFLVLSFTRSYPPSAVFTKILQYSSVSLTVCLFLLTVQSLSLSTLFVQFLSPLCLSLQIDSFTLTPLCIVCLSLYIYIYICLPELSLYSLSLSVYFFSFFVLSDCFSLFFQYSFSFSHHQIFSTI
ncbi:unnamed protein product [Acanthosepion pharaonis]|uniref:Uncharacterized protein n=1 Tax=Acanthosepion pharaonis TaxID=158019 RepID=A0A812E2J6_ACAPH|nr:unnamed protein product [Sepia pharaonis]